MKLFKLSFILMGLLFLNSCRLENAPKGLQIDYPYFITKDSVVVKKIKVPKGTKLVYNESPIYKGVQIQMLDENQLSEIEFQDKDTIYWGGVPITHIRIFFNDEIPGYTVYADFTRLSESKKTKFSELWERYDDGLGVKIKNLDDWSFNQKNISDINDCGLNQRYFKEDIKQQKTLDSILNEMKKIEVK